MFIDESGNHSTSDCYTLAGVWCLTEYDAPEEVFKPTRDRIANQVVQTDGELKGEELSDTKLDSCLFYARNVFEQDGSLVPTDCWGTGYSAAFSVYDSDSETVRDIVTQYLGEGANASVTAQLVGLASVTSPILRLDDHVPVEIVEHNVVLDGTTWRRAGETLRRIYESSNRVSEIRFSYRDSKNTPGIQLADLAAHARRLRLTTGDCVRGSQVVDEMRL